MTKIVSFLKLIFHSSILFLIIISLFPGSLLGLMFYGDISKQPDLIPEAFGISINHFIFYFYVSILGLVLYVKNEKFKVFLYSLFVLSVILEALHLVVPNRTFEIGDLAGNVFGVLAAYFLVNIYLSLKKR